MTAAFSLIIPHSDIEVGRFRLLGAALPQMPGWCNDLSYACALSSPVANLWRPPASAVTALQALLAGRDAWLVCNYASADEGDLVATHAALHAEFPRVLTVYVPADPTRAAAICAAFAADGRTTARCTSSCPTSRAPSPNLVPRLALCGAARAASRMDSCHVQWRAWARWWWTRLGRCSCS